MRELAIRWIALGKARQDCDLSLWVKPSFEGTSVIGRYCCKSRKSNNPKNLAKVDLWTSLLLRRFSTPLRRSVAAKRSWTSVGGKDADQEAVREFKESLAAPQASRSYLEQVAALMYLGSLIALLRVRIATLQVICFALFGCQFSDCPNGVPYRLQRRVLAN
jgi:hypothetical protein